jgi:hypothetical protein
MIKADRKEASARPDWFAGAAPSSFKNALLFQ